MSTSRTCNSSLWTKEENKILENILIEDIDVIESERVPLPDYPEEPRDSNQNSEASIGWRRGAFLSEEEHRRTSVPPFMVSYP
ncbi:hypothetical protein CQW23_21304 [Capsicum baccatum]|uniref:Uncharacterized protein n=1 Tax=Capsicum baccatum TaxID=33114 RepID=A0A2G2VXN9_CAPBA|nr:hypothetical protein CQW23_21304 [Capsicum baccatum]